MTIIMAPVITEKAIYDKKYWKNINGTDLASWTDNSIFKNKAILLSYAYCYKQFFGARTVISAKEFLEVSKDVLVVGDSGGHSIYTKGIDINPADLAAWANRSADIVASLDVPYIKGTKPVDLATVERHAKRTRELTEVQVKHLSDEVEFMPVVHGRNEKELNIWWKIAVEPFLDRADGLFLAPTHMNFVLFQLEWVRRFTDFKKIHLLGFNYPRIYFIRIYEKFFDRITFDSSTNNRAAEHSIFIMPYTLQGIKFGQRIKHGKKTSCPKIRICDCPVCRFFETHYSIERMYLPDDYMSYHALSLHNNYVLQQFFDLSKVLFNILLRVVPEKVRAKVTEAIDWIESKEFPPKKFSVQHSLSEVV